MKFPEPTTLRGATSPIILASWVFAIGIFEYPTGHPRPVMSLCWSIAHLFIFFSLVTVAASRNLIRLHVSTVTIVTYRFFMFINVTSVIVFVCFGRTTSKIVSASIRKLNTVTEMMNKYEISKEYRSTFKYQIIQVTGAFISVSVLIALNIAIFTNGYHYSIPDLCYLVAIHYPPTYNFIVDCMFATFIRHIGKLFQHLNTDLIHCSSQKNNTNSFLHGLELDGSLRPTTLGTHENPYTFRLADKQCMLHLICNSRKIHQELCRTARNLNEAFAVQILLSVAMSTVLITASLYGIYKMLLTSTSVNAQASMISITISTAWLTFYTAKVLYIVCACSMTSTQAQRMVELIHRLDEPTADRQVREEIHAFSILLMQNPLRFAASGFFTLDFEMICSLVGTITTYLVIMIQLHNFYDPESKSSNATPRAMNATY